MSARPLQRNSDTILSRYVPAVERWSAAAQFQEVAKAIVSSQLEFRPVNNTASGSSRNGLNTQSTQFLSHSTSIEGPVVRFHITKYVIYERVVSLHNFDHNSRTFLVRLSVKKNLFSKNAKIFRYYTDQLNDVGINPKQRRTSNDFQNFQIP